MEDSKYKIVWELPDGTQDQLPQDSFIPPLDLDIAVIHLMNKAAELARSTGFVWIQVQRVAP